MCGVGIKDQLTNLTFQNEWHNYLYDRVCMFIQNHHWVILQGLANHFHSLRGLVEKSPSHHLMVLTVLFGQALRQVTCLSRKLSCTRRKLWPIQSRINPFAPLISLLLNIWCLRESCMENCQLMRISSLEDVLFLLCVNFVFNMKKVYSTCVLNVLLLSTS